MKKQLSTQKQWSLRPTATQMPGGEVNTLFALCHLLQKASLDYLEIDWNVLAPDSWKGKEDDGRDMRFFKLFGMSQMMGTLA